MTVLAHRVGSLRRTDSVAIEGVADIRRSLAARRSDANDPPLTSARSRANATTRADPSIGRLEMRQTDAGLTGFIRLTSAGRSGLEWIYRWNLKIGSSGRLRAPSSLSHLSGLSLRQSFCGRSANSLHCFPRRLERFLSAQMGYFSVFGIN